MDRRNNGNIINKNGIKSPQNLSISLQKKIPLHVFTSQLIIFNHDQRL